MGSPVVFRLPGSATVVFNSLYDDMPTVLLMSDIAAIRLAGGRWIDVGWWPQFDPRGEYHIGVWSDAKPGEMFAATTAGTAREVVEVVADYAEIYG